MKLIVPALRTNSIAKSRAPLATCFTPLGIVPMVLPKSDGAATNWIRTPGFNPSFATRGVPE